MNRIIVERGVMVWCLHCKTVVWAYDHEKTGRDIAGTCNVFRLPCPECGDSSGGYIGAEGFVIALDLYQFSDIWTAMQAYALLWQLTWKPSPNNEWGKQPDEKWLIEQEVKNLKLVGRMIADGVAERFFGEELDNVMSSLRKVKEA